MATRTKKVLRWIGFVPGAFVGAFLASVIANLLARLPLGYLGATPESLTGFYYLTILNSAAMGAAFVYCGARIAPTKQRNVAYILAGVGLVLTGFFSYPILMETGWWAVWSLVSTIFGIGAVTVALHRGDIDLTRSLFSYFR